MESPIELGKAWALVKRDIYNWTSYKSQMVTSITGAILGIASWGLIGTFNTTLVTQYDTNYVTFLVTGILIANIIMPVSSGISSRLSPWSIETVLMTGMSAPTYVLGTAGWAYMLAVVFTIPQLILGFFLFPLEFHVNYVSMFVALVLSGAIMFSLSMISAGVRLVTKVSDPVTWFLTVAQSLLAGMTFPISHLNSILPGLSTVSWFIPQTWIYDTFRLAVLDNGSLADPSVGFAFLGATLFAVIMVPIGAYIFRWGLTRAKKEGTIGWY
jgi:ABC-2 type transport system permease protein